MESLGISFNPDESNLLSWIFLGGLHRNECRNSNLNLCPLLMVKTSITKLLLSNVHVPFELLILSFQFFCVNQQPKNKIYWLSTTQYKSWSRSSLWVPMLDFQSAIGTDFNLLHFTNTVWTITYKIVTFCTTNSINHWMCWKYVLQ